MIPFDPKFIPAERRAPGRRRTVTIKYKTEHGSNEVTLDVLGQDDEGARREARRIFEESQREVAGLAILSVEFEVQP